MTDWFVWIVADALLDGETIVGDIELFESEEGAKARADELGVTYWSTEILRKRVSP